MEENDKIIKYMQETSYYTEPECPQSVVCKLGKQIKAVDLLMFYLLI